MVGIRESRRDATVNGRLLAHRSSVTSYLAHLAAGALAQSVINLEVVRALQMSTPTDLQIPPPFQSHEVAVRRTTPGQVADELLRRRMASPRSKSLMVPSKGFQTFQTAEEFMLQPTKSSNSRSLAAAAAAVEQKLLQTRQLSSDTEFLPSPVTTAEGNANRRSMGYRPKRGRHPSQTSRGRITFLVLVLICGQTIPP